jgi:DNA polymerase-3 subunit delta
VAATAPVVYIFHGDDEFSISRNLTALKTKMGDPSIAELNTTHLDGRTANLDELVTSSAAMPFLSDRRLVIVDHAAALGERSPERQTILDFLKKIPQTTALVLVEDHILTDYQMERRGEVHWLESWGRGEGERVLIKRFVIPSGGQLVDWIVKRVTELGGEISSPAASLLGRMDGEDLRAVNQEIEKLLAYVNFDRRIEFEDVEALTILERPDSIFNLVDAIGNRDRKSAVAQFHSLLLDQEIFSIQGMIVRQFRLMLLGKVVLEEGGDEGEIARRLAIKRFVANKIASQARKFSRSELEGIYRRLLDLDVALKTGVMDVELNIDLLIEAVTRIPTE